MGVRRLISAVIAATMTLGLVLVPASSASALSGKEQRFVTLINAERKKRGLRPLAVKADIVSVARYHAKRMAERERVWHDYSLYKRIKGASLVLDNAGGGFDVDEIHAGFMASKGHRKQIIDPRFNQLGVAIAVSDRGIMYTSHFFVRRGTTTTKPKTTVQRRTTTTTEKATSSAPRAVKPSSPPPAPPLPPPEPPVRTVDMLLRLAELDPDLPAGTGP